jgi:hypothetical protein
MVMSDSPPDAPLDPAAQRLIGRVRWLMLISGATTLLAIAAVLGVTGYRVFRSEGSIAPLPARAVTAMLPKGARVVAITAAGDRIVVTIELAGALEARTFDARTLQPAGSLRFETQP